MELKAVSTKKYKTKQIIRTARSLLLSIVGLGLSTVTLVGCNSRGRQLAGVQQVPDSLSKTDSEYIQMRLGGAPPLPESTLIQQLPGEIVICTTEVKKK